MLNILVGAVTLAVLAVLGYFTGGDLLHTIGSGAEKSFASAGWANAFQNSARLETHLEESRLTVSGLRDAMSQNAPALGFLERLCNMTNTNGSDTVREPLGQLRTEMSTAGQTPYLPILTTHIDFDLQTIDSANERYNASVEAKRLLTAQGEQLRTTLAKYDKLLIDADTLRAQLDQRIEQLERYNSEAKKYETDRKDLQAKADDYDALHWRASKLENDLQRSYARNLSLSQSFMEKTKEHKAVINQLEQANTKCDGLQNTLTNVTGNLKGTSDRCGQLEAKLKAGNDRWDTFSRGPSDIEDASGTPLPAAIDGELDGLPGDATSLHNPDQPSGSARLDGQFPAHVSRPSPAMTRQYSLGSVPAASGFAAADFGSFAARPLAGNLESGTFPSMNGISGSSRHAPLAPKPDSSSDRNGVANKVNPQGQTDQSSSSVSKPPATAASGTTSPQPDSPSSPAPQSASEGSKAEPKDGMDTNPTPTPEQHPGVPSADGTNDSAAKPTPAPQGPDSSTPEPPQPRGRSPTRSNASSTGTRSSTPVSRQSGFPSPPGSGRGSAPYRGGRDSRGRGGNDDKPEQSDYMNKLLGGKGGKAPGKGPASGKPPRGRAGN
ncbi:MAG: hypothetical protein Q9221_000286 [Calogaya cf. arnoldii]